VVRQGRLLSPTLFVIYLDVLISGVGCRLLDAFYGCLLYVDDIVLLTHSLNAIRVMLDVCDTFSIDFDITFNANKSVVMRVGERFDTGCVSRTLAGRNLQNIESIKYLGMCLCAAKYSKCSLENVKTEFFGTFNAIYFKSKGADSELVSVEFLKSYFLPFMLYTTKVIPLNKTNVNTLQNCLSSEHCCI
jgi:Reverse transcriptase (RNA-dependent DNA polymerase)